MKEANKLDNLTQLQLKLNAQVLVMTSALGILSRDAPPVQLNADIPLQTKHQQQLQQQLQEGESAAASKVESSMKEFIKDIVDNVKEIDRLIDTLPEVANGGEKDLQELNVENEVAYNLLNVQQKRMEMFNRNLRALITQISLDYSSHSSSA